MNCLDVRRVLATDPNSRDEALLEHVSQCDDCAAAFSSSRQFERALRQSVNVPVPEDLASKILLKQSFAETETSRSWWKWPLAVAATVVLALSIHFGSSLVSDPAVKRLGQDVVALVNAAGYALEPTTPVAHETVREALKPLGLDLAAELQDVTFASRCYLRGKLAGHLVVRDEGAPVTVFVIPHSLVDAEADFDEEQWSGRLLPTVGGTIAIVAEPGRKVDEVARKVQNALRWKA